MSEDQVPLPRGGATAGLPTPSKADLASEQIVLEIGDYVSGGGRDKLAEHLTLGRRFGLDLADIRRQWDTARARRQGSHEPSEPTPTYVDLARLAHGALVPAAAEPTGGETLGQHGEERRQHGADAILASTRLEVSSREPLKIAELFIEQHYRDGVVTLRRQSEVFYHWDGKRYSEIETETLEMQLYAFLKLAVTQDGSGHKPFNPDREIICKVIHALGRVVHLEQRVAAPAWLDDEQPVPDLTKLFACKNWLLYGPTREKIPHDPRFWSHNVLEFDYDPEAKAPRWEQFLSEIWDEDEEAKRTLQQIFGYCLTDDIRQHKIFLLLGPPRSGKGTIGRVLRGLIGAENCISPTANNMTSTDFGLQNWIGKKVAVFSDASFSGSAGIKATEHFKTISGADPISINRKNTGFWNGTLGTRIFILTNDLPKFHDDSGALAKRFISLPTKKTFYGKEDPNLTDTLLAERPGILNWALDGLAQLYDKGYFVQPACGKETGRMLEVTSSQFKTFVEEMCDRDQDLTVQKTTLYTQYCKWADAAKISRVGITPPLFSRQLRDAFPEIKDGGRPGEKNSEGRLRVWSGIRLKSSAKVVKPVLPTVAAAPVVLPFLRRI